MTTFLSSRITARSLFVAPENIAAIKDALRMRRTGNFTSAQLGAWYDNYMISHRVEPAKIEDVQIWADFMTGEFIREWVGRHNVSAEQVPYLPYDLPHDDAFGGVGRPGGPEMRCNQQMVSRPQPSGRFPKFNLPSAVEDGVDENGEIVIHNEHATIRMFQPITGRQGRGWRFGKNDPIVMNRIAGGRPQALQDDEYNGTLYDWELLNRPHTAYPMDEFFTIG